MTALNLKTLLEAGAHFGHQTKKWNPKMAPFIFGEKNKIHIIDLQKTLKSILKAQQFIEDVAAAGGTVLFVGTKRQAQVAVEEQAKRSGSYFINQRWLGGMLTNFETIRLSIVKMIRMRQMVEADDYGHLTKKEINSLKKELQKLEKNLSGIQELGSLPAAIFIVDPKREHIAVKEAQTLKIPLAVLLDTNCDPTGIQYLIPGNDDAIRSIDLFASLIADAILRGKARRSEKLAEAAQLAAQAAAAAEAESIHVGASESADDEEDATDE